MHGPFLQRPRLVERLDEAVESAPLTHVVAPLGAGKTALVAGWAGRHDARWLGPGQHDRLLEQVLDVHGLEPTSLDEDAAVAGLRGLERRAPAVVVIDAATGLSDDARSLLTRLVTDAPRAVRLVLLTREEPLLPVLDRPPAVLDAPDLRFTDEEAAALVRLLAPQVDQPELERTVAEARGWAIALEVAARGHRLGHADAPASAASGPSHLLMHALSGAPQELSHLLLSTCDEERFDVPTAVALSGDARVDRLLTRHAADGLVVERTGESERGDTFALNPILRRTLQHHARDRGPAYDARVAAHRRAAETLLRQGADPATAVRHAVLSGDEQTLLHALRARGHGLLSPSRQQLLSRALDALPPGLRSGDPAILVLESMLCRLQLRYDEASELSSAADQRAASRPSEVEDELSLDCRALMRLWRARCGWADPHTAVASARERLGCLHPATATHRVAPGQSLVWSSWLMGELATVEIRTGDLDAAGLHLGELIHNARALGHRRMLAAGLAHRSLLEMIDGSFQTAGATARSSLEQLAAESTADLPYISLAHLVAGWAALHQLDVEGCARHLAAADREPAMERDSLVVELAGILRAKLLAEQGLVEDARRLLAQNRSAYEATPLFMLRLKAITDAHTAALVNDLAMVRSRVVTLNEIGCVEDAELFGALVDVGEGRLEEGLARVQVVLGQPGLDLVTAAGGAALRLGLLLIMGRADRAAQGLPDLLNRVAPQRLLQMFTIGFLAGDAFAQLLVEEAQRPDGHPYASEALEGLDRYLASPARDSPRARAVEHALSAVWATRPEPVAGGSPTLTRREHDVLAELSLGGSYSDVAEALFVSENTVKTHVASVYRKLGVDRRGDALRRARATGLL